MQLRSILAAVLLAASLALCAGCRSNVDPAAAEAIGALPFSVPETFAFSEEATAQNGMLTFTSRDGTTLIVSCAGATPEFLETTRSQKITAASLTAAYKESGLDVSIDGLETQPAADSFSYTYTVRLANQNGNTVTRKYIRVTEGQILDISCGGAEARAEQVGADYEAVVRAVAEGARAEAEAAPEESSQP